MAGPVSTDALAAGGCRLIPAARDCGPTLISEFNFLWPHGIHGAPESVADGASLFRRGTDWA
jgi:hypothetical protein